LIFLLIFFDKDGPHTQKKSILISTNASSIARFAIKKETCLSCKCVIDTINSAVCLNCKPNESQIYQNLIREQSILESKFSRLWAHCQRTSNSIINFHLFLYQLYKLYFIVYLPNPIDS